VRVHPVLTSTFRAYHGSKWEEDGVQGLSVWRRVLGIEGRTVLERVDVDGDGTVVASVRPRRDAPMRCGRCGREAPGYDRGEGRRRWRALDVGTLRMVIEADAPRVDCIWCGPTVVAVPWARHNARHTYEFDQTVAWLARFCAKRSVAWMFRIAWETVGSIIVRVMADVTVHMEDRFANVRRIGIDEVSYGKGNKFLVVVFNHDNGQLLWVGTQRLKATLGKFFDELGDERCQRIELVSADGADWIADMVGIRCPNAKLCMDPYHVIVWVNKALDRVRGRVISTARRDGATDLVDLVKDSRWALLKNPTRLSDKQQRKLADIAKINNQLYRAYLLKEQLRQVFAPGGADRVRQLDEWLAWAARSQIAEFVELARKMRRYRDDIAHTLTHQLTNAAVEGLNSRIRHLINIARGFRSVDALKALMRLHLGPYQPTLPGRPAHT